MRFLSTLIGLLVVLVSVTSDHDIGKANTGAEAAAQEEAIHPRLFFTDDDLPLLRERASTTHRLIWESIKAYVDSELGSQPPDVAPVFGTLEDYRNFGNRLIPFAFACLIAQDPAYCDLARDFLMAFVTWQQWDEPGRRDLGLAHMLLGTTIAYDWMYDALSADERRLVRDAVARWAHRMHQASADGYRDAWTNWWAYSFIQNHFSTNHSALGLAALALRDDIPVRGDQPVECTVIAESDVNLRWEPNTALDIAGILPAGEPAPAVAQLTGDDGIVWWQLPESQWVRSDVVDESGDCQALPLPEWIDPELWLDRATQQIALLTYVLNGIMDGSWHEGMVYQSYMLTVLLPFLSNLERLEGVDLFPRRYLDNYVEWRLYNFLPNTTHPLFSTGDLEWWWGNAYNSQNILRFIAREFNNPHAQWLADEIAAVDGYGQGHFVSPWVVFEFLNYDASIPAEPPDDLALSRTFPDFEGVIWRTGWGESDMTFALKTGAVGGRFNFNTFTARLYPWDLPCLGNGCTYNTSHDHADANSFVLYRNGTWLAPEVVGMNRGDTIFHNTLLIDGLGQYVSPEQGVVSPDRVAGTDGYLELSVSLPHFDFAAANATRPYHASVPTLETYTRSALFLRPEYVVMVDYFRAPEAHVFEWITHTQSDVTIEENWVRAAAINDQVLGIGVAAPSTFTFVTEQDQLTRLRIGTARAVPDGRFLMLLYPTDTNDWDSRPVFYVLADSPDEAAVRIHSRTDEGRIDDVFFGFAERGTVYEGGLYAHDMRVGAVSYHDPLRPEKIFAVGGTFITDEGTGLTLVSNLNGSEPFEAFYDGTTVEVAGNVRSAISLYAPGVERLLVNGQSMPFERQGDVIVFGQDMPATAQPDATQDQTAETN